jgi:hypothetical protein
MIKSLQKNSKLPFKLGLLVGISLLLGAGLTPIAYADGEVGIICGDCAGPANPDSPDNIAPTPIQPRSLPEPRRCDMCDIGAV